MDPVILVRADGPSPKVSVAVSSRNRSHLLARLIDCLETQTLSNRDFEVVIVDDHSTDDTAGELEALARKTELAMTAASLPDHSGPAVGRNAAWRLARGEIVAFTDDDCQPSPGWLAEGLDSLDRCDVVVGRVIPDPAQEHLSGPFSRTMNVFDERYLATCNIFYRRRDLEAVDGFDEDFPRRPAGGEDTDLGWRVRDGLSRTVCFAPEALVLHDVRASSFRAKVRETLRWTGIARMTALHPENARRSFYKRFFWKDTHPKTIVAVAGLAMAVRFWPAALFVVPWLRMRLRANRSPRWIVALPGMLVIDALEVAVMIRGSVENRTLVL